MKILIVGSKGFIGTKCVEHFSRENDVWQCDVYPGYGEENYFSVEPSAPLYYNLFNKQTFDACINCSGAASVPDSFLNPVRDYELNTHNVFRLLESIRATQPGCKFINLSSAAVYGNPQALPVNEEYPLNPISPYGVHKMQADQLCLEYSNFFNVHTCTFRIFSAYGPGLRKQIFWDWLAKADKTHVITLPGTGKETRDYIYIDDITRAVEIVLTKAAFQGEVYNLGSGVESAIDEAARLFFQILNWKGTLNFTGAGRAGDPLRWKADITKLHTLGFTPKMTLETGIEKYITWAKKLR
jgi:UDP-glucose 4-epimerase